MIRVYQEMIMTLNCSLAEALQTYIAKDPTIDVIEVCPKCPVGIDGGFDFTTNKKAAVVVFKFCPCCGRRL